MSDAKSIKDKSRYLVGRAHTKRRNLKKETTEEDLTVGSSYRAYGSTHKSATKDRITRNRHKASRQKAKKETPQ